LLTQVDVVLSDIFIFKLNYYDYSLEHWVNRLNIYDSIYDFLDKNKDSSAIKHIQKRLMDQGYDGMVYLNKHEGFDRETTSKLLKGNYSTLKNMGESDFMKIAPNAQESYIAFKPSQIKSAITGD